MESQRNHLMDNLKAVLIFLVVFAHFLTFYVDKDATSIFVEGLTYFIFSFHMPLFVFICGFFSKNVDKVRRTSFVRLLLPYLFFNTLMMFSEAYATHDRSNVQLLTPVYVNWFLLSLFFWRIILKDLIRIKLVLPVSVFVALFIGFAGEANNVLALSRTIVFLPFFLLGYYTTDNAIKYVRSTNRLLALAVIGVTAWIIYLATISGYLSLAIFMAIPYSSLSGLTLRIAYLVVAMLMGFALIVLCPEKKLPLVTNVGANSLVIFLLHRYVNFVFCALVTVEQWQDAHVLVGLGLSVLTVLVLGSPVFARAYDVTFKFMLSRISHEHQPESPAGKSLPRYLSVPMLLALPMLYAVYCGGLNQPDRQADVIHPVMDSEFERSLSSAATISFVGDLILLENQVKQAWNAEAETYDFSPVFEYATKYFQQADYSIGVLELPTAGEAVGYSTSNYGDGHSVAPECTGSMAPSH